MKSQNIKWLFEKWRRIHNVLYKNSDESERKEKNGENKQ